MTNALEDSLVALRRIIRATESDSRALAKRADMATSELHTLQVVEDNPGISPGELARALGLSPVTSTVILQKLESRELVQKIRSRQDKRRLEVVLTERGRQELGQAPSSLHRVFSHHFTELAPWEQHQIAAVLGRVIGLLGADNLET
ncbi:MAG: MarR family winged helix-turn-helix transcriptional regulator [Limnobacter sp.]|uniref:MarR family winged helix-turn-helix transcriptional regulator n=1 Tax=Limnobacter sp. TaxID=2003368 RepID=UPI00391C8A3B